MACVLVSYVPQGTLPLLPTPLTLVGLQGISQMMKTLLLGPWSHDTNSSCTEHPVQNATRRTNRTHLQDHLRPEFVHFIVEPWSLPCIPWLPLGPFSLAFILWTLTGRVPGQGKVLLPTRPGPGYFVQEVPKQSPWAPTSEAGVGGKTSSGMQESPPLHLPLSLSQALPMRTFHSTHTGANRVASPRALGNASVGRFVCSCWAKAQMALRGPPAFASPCPMGPRMEGS